MINRAYEEELKSDDKEYRNSWLDFDLESMKSD